MAPDLIALARSGGLRCHTRGTRAKITLSSAQIGLIERIVGKEEDAADDSQRRLVIGAMEMGSGKTLAALAALCVLRGRLSSNGRRARALFVVPKSTLYDSWKRQMKAFTRLSSHSVEIITYPALQRAFTKGWTANSDSSLSWARGSGNPILETERDLLVFDESHVIRNPSTLLARASLIASQNSKRVLCLTGTPVHNGPKDASGQLRAMGSGSYLEDPASFGDLSNLCPEAVHAFTSRFMYTTTLAETGVKLPEKLSEVIWVSHDLSPALVNQYNESLRAVTNGKFEECGESGDRNVRHHMLVLRQLCVEPALFHKHGRDTFDGAARRATVDSPGPKLCAAVDLIRRMTFEGHTKIVVVSEFVTLLDVFRELVFKRLGERSLAFDGRLSESARGRVVKRFLTGADRLLCLSLGAGAYGLNLTPGPTAMIILDVWFNPAVHRQVEARIHRIGTTKPVKVYTLVTTHSVEEAILKTHDRKQACATSLMSGESDETSISPREAHRIAQDCKPFSSAPQSARQVAV
ncbi:MAG: DEAD/DEAH box helicase [Flavobacteriales bacterium]